MSGPPAQTLVTHLINQTLSSLSTLESLNIISRDDATQIRARLPNPYGPFPSLETKPTLHTSFSQLSVHTASPPSQNMPLHPSQTQSLPSSTPQSQSSHNMPLVPSLPPRAPPREVRARALWDYSGTEPDDLRFQANDTIIVDEEVNDQWYRGRVIPAGQHLPLERAGLFPSNYIEKHQPNDKAFSPAPLQPMIPYQQHYQGPPQHSMTHAPGQVAITEQEKKNRFGKIGAKLGDSAVHGAGFGFGASIASNMVNKIF